MESRSHLSRSQLACLAPSVFAQAPAGGVSSRYCFVPTIKVVDALARRDWFPVEAGQAKARTEEGMPYKRHLVRFGNASFPAVNGILPEIVLFNSHDATSSFYLMSGLFRLACLNGLLVYDDVFSVFIIRHVGYKDQQVVTAETRLVEEIPLVSERISAFQEIVLTSQERFEFAGAAAWLRWHGKMPDIDPLCLLAARRPEDGNGTLWSTLNVVQENLFKGGVRGQSRKTVRKITTREIKNVAEQVRVNRILWQLAEKVRTAKHAGGAA